MASKEFQRLIQLMEGDPRKPPGQRGKFGRNSGATDDELEILIRKGTGLVREAAKKVKSRRKFLRDARKFVKSRRK